MAKRSVPTLIGFALLVAVLAQAPAEACVSANMMSHRILPTIPEDVTADEAILRVMQRRQPSLAERDRGYLEVPVLRVIQGRYGKKTVFLPLNMSSCEMIGVVGGPGFIVVKRYPKEWVISSYLVWEGRTGRRGSELIPLP